MTKLLTEGTLVIESSAAFLILTPVFWRWTRFVAALLLVGLHGGIALLVNLGIFSAAMIAFQPFLFTEAQWTLFARWSPRAAGAHRLLRRRLRRLLGDRARAGADGRLQTAALGAEHGHRRAAAGDRRRAARPDDAGRSIPGAIAAGRAPTASPRSSPRCRSAACGPGRCACRASAALAGRAYDAFARNRTAISTSRLRARRRAAVRAGHRRPRGGRAPSRGHAASRVVPRAGAVRARGLARGRVRRPRGRGLGGQPGRAGRRSASTTARTGWWPPSCTRTSSRGGRCSRPTRRSPTRRSTSTRSRATAATSTPTTRSAAASPTSRSTASRSAWGTTRSGATTRCVSPTPASTTRRSSSGCCAIPSGPETRMTRSPASTPTSSSRTAPARRDGPDATPTSACFCHWP